jgi:CheY-like chemotaxis protein
MGGDIGFESRPGEGSTFWFTVTLKYGVEGRSRNRTLVERLAGKRVLVVDDHPLSRRILASLLSARDVAVRCVSDTRQARSALLQTVEAGQPFDLVLVDQRMPGEDGLQFGDYLVNEPSLASIRRVLLASIGTMPRAREIEERGFHGLVPKPVKQGDLERVLLSVLDLLDPVPVPLSGPLPRELDSGEQAVSKTQSLKRILLVEDNLVNERVALGMLRIRGHTVVVARNGIEALNTVRDEAFDLILMDCQMPEMDGYEATRRIRSMRGGWTALPIVAMTANTMEGDREKCLAAGMSDYLSKPFTAEQLSLVVDRALASRSPNRSGSARVPEEA